MAALGGDRRAQPDGAARSSTPTRRSTPTCCAGKRMCLCGMLAAEYETLPEPMRDAVLRFFDENEAWLVRVLEQGRTEGTVSFSGPASVVAQSIISGLEGALLIARPYGDVGRFDRAANRLLSGVMETPPPDDVAAGSRVRTAARRR